MTAPTPTYFNRVFNPSYCKTCGKEDCRPVSVCCGAEEDSDIEGFCPQCREHTGFECPEAEEVTAK